MCWYKELEHRTPGADISFGGSLKWALFEYKMWLYFVGPYPDLDGVKMLYPPSWSGPTGMLW